MRPILSVSGKTGVALILVALSSAGEGRPGPHKHHHNGHLPREGRSTAVSPDSSLIINPTAGVCNSNNVLAHAIAGISLDTGPCTPNSTAPATIPVGTAYSVPTVIQTVTLEVREEFQWSDWKHGPYRERVTRTRSRRDTSDTTHNTGSSSTATLTQSSSSSSSVTSTSATASSVCPAGNGTAFNSGASKQYKVLCDVDFPDNDFPFQMVQSYDECVSACDTYNAKAGSNRCVAALFVPQRLHDADDCYLKYSVDHPTSATVGIEGAVLVLSTQSTTTSPTSTDASTSTTSVSKSTSSIQSHQAVPSSTNTASPQSAASTVTANIASVSQSGVTYASGDSVITPKVSSSQLQGPSQNLPTNQYIEIKDPEELLTLSSSLLTIGVNGDLTTNYDISSNTGVLQVNASTQASLSSMSETPHLSRDGGRGGFLNGEHLFLFCDTGSYTTTTEDSNGKFLGFVSSSVAIDVGMNGLNGKPLTLQDGIGQWSDNTGRMRSLSPLTQGEEAYNQVMQGQGGRYAIWPESSLISLDATTSIIYAPIVYDNVNTATKAAVFTYTGATLLQITAGGKGGPVAVRANKKIFDQDEVEWGCAGGIRSWGASGIGGDDGSVYLFGNVNGGILLARTLPKNVADRDSYEYWNGNSWTTGMQSPTSKAYFIEGPYMDIDIFYSPRHLTFIAVYLTVYADSTFYYRYLKADEAILPPYAPAGDESSDYVENILKYEWSDQQVLYKAATGLSGKYIYSGGVHANYYGSNDIANGGSKMLLSWTAPTGLDPSTQTSEYQIITAEIDWA